MAPAQRVIIVADQMELDPSSGSLFLFYNRQRSILKGLLWDRNGFLLLQNVLRAGTRSPGQIASGPPSGKSVRLLPESRTQIIDITTHKKTSEKLPLPGQAADLTASS
ncbi:IS66 family insertion sequence element accessory protein TnpB [Alkalispirochaeta alkalica]|uniref:IS66 family insertion sequence element accessory protein TnpB n=1 Tax=Alkalispirochaeta alkalica TaxID=46356 RepID=UPI0003AA0DB9